MTAPRKKYQLFFLGVSSFFSGSHIKTPHFLFPTIYRWVSEWLKPTDKLYLGQSAIQWAYVVGVAYYIGLMCHLKRNNGALAIDDEDDLSGYI